MDHQPTAQFDAQSALHEQLAERTAGGAALGQQQDRRQAERGLPAPACLVACPVILFEILSLSRNRSDGILKVREYRAVPSILGYVIFEYTTVAASVFYRTADQAEWTATTLTSENTLYLPAIAVSVPLIDLFEGTDLAGAS